MPGGGPVPVGATALGGPGPLREPCCSGVPDPQGPGSALTPVGRVSGDRPRSQASPWAPRALCTPQRHPPARAQGSGFSMGRCVEWQPSRVLGTGQEPWAIGVILPALRDSRASARQHLCDVAGHRALQLHSSLRQVHRRPGLTGGFLVPRETSLCLQSCLQGRDLHVQSVLGTAQPKSKKAVLPVAMSCSAPTASST